jgi:putative membrane protein
MKKRFDGDAIRRIGNAVRELESVSAVELVVEIRARSGSYAHADARFAFALVLASLVVLVFMPLVVPPETVLVDAIAMYIVGLVIARHSDALRRLFTTPRERLQAVRTHAAALFHPRGISNTSGETGLLFFVSLLERRVEVLADRGVLQKVSPNDWNAALADLRVERTVDSDAIIECIRRLALILQRDVPAAAGDQDELTSEVQVS